MNDQYDFNSQNFLGKSFDFVFQSPIVVLIKSHSIVAMLQPPSFLLASPAHCLSLSLLLLLFFAPSCPSFRFPEPPLHVDLPFAFVHRVPLSLRQAKISPDEIMLLIQGQGFPEDGEPPNPSEVEQ